MTVSDEPLAALCKVSPAEIKIDLNGLFSPEHIDGYLARQQATWRNLHLHREEQVEQIGGLECEIGVRGSVSIKGGPAEDTNFALCDVPSNGIYGSVIVLDCFLGNQGQQYFVVIAKVNPYGCRDTDDNIILPYVASVHPRVLGDGHPLGDDGIARQMIINRHYGIS